MNNNILTLQTENHKLKDQINKFKQVCGLVPYIEDSTLKGGYRIVSSIQERDAIDICHRKIGMIVSVRITETEYKNYRLISKNNWVEVTSDGTIPGLSNYDLAVLDGFQGTLGEYLESLKGEDGYTPIKDVDYFDGDKGDKGDKGLQGIPGIDGSIQTITMDVNDDMHLILQISSNPTIEMIIDTDGHLKLI